MSTWVVGPVPLPFLLLDTESVVVPGVPVGVHLQMFLPLHSGLLVILRLLVSAQRMPLYMKEGTIDNRYKSALIWLLTTS